MFDNDFQARVLLQMGNEIFKKMVVSSDRAPQFAFDTDVSYYFF
jgi:hypothetical protein